MEVTMWWQCSECGCRVRRQRKPNRCPECGIAGLLTKEPEASASWGTIDDLRLYWFDLGMKQARLDEFETSLSGHS